MTTAIERTAAADSCSMVLTKGDGTIVDLDERDSRESKKQEIRESAEEILDKMQTILAKMDEL